MADTVIPSIIQQFISEDNFRLAWKRVRYYDRPDSRDWLGLRVFSSALDDNLRILRQSVSDSVFQPGSLNTKYIPKKSKTLRPMAYLSIPDRIVFQAVVNIIAERARPQLSIVSNRQAFANCLVESPGARFLAHWKSQYPAFRDTYSDLATEGNLWVAETDITAFYETIDHELLLSKLLSRGYVDLPLQDILRDLLLGWNNLGNDVTVSRGLPQGCIASDLLANVYLLDIDIAFAARDSYYIRYVDDIRILASTRERAYRGLIALDMKVKELGLMLQSAKTDVRYVTDLDAEIDLLSTQLSELDTRLRESEAEISPRFNDGLTERSFAEINLMIDEPDDLFPSEYDDLIITSSEDMFGPEALAILEELDAEEDAYIQRELVAVAIGAIGELEDPSQDRPNPIFAERHLRFALNRLKPTPEVSMPVLRYLDKKPWLSDTIARYLARGPIDEPTAAFLKELIATDAIYEGIVADTIRVLLKHKIDLRLFHSIFRSLITDSSVGWQLQEACILALGESADNMSAIIACKTNTSSVVRRMAAIQALRLCRTKEESLHVAAQFLEDRALDVVLAVLYLVYTEWDLTIGDFHHRIAKMSDECVAYASAYGSPPMQVGFDYIRNEITKGYGVDVLLQIDFHELLGDGAYEHAARHLRDAHRSSKTNPSRYASKLDLFHEEIVLAVLTKHVALGNPELIRPLGIPDRALLLERVATDLLEFVAAIRLCRGLRANPETHSRLHNTLSLTTHVSEREQRALHKQ